MASFAALTLNSSRFQEHKKKLPQISNIVRKADMATFRIFLTLFLGLPLSTIATV